MAVAVEENLRSSLAALQDYFSPSHRNDVCGNPSQLVVFAEHAAKDGYGAIASESLQFYYRLNPPQNQFFIRAYLCEAMVAAMYDNESGLSEEDLVQSLSFILKAVDMASKSSCYYFLVENAAVLMWNICRPFLRPGKRKSFCKPLQVVVKALEQCGCQDQDLKLELQLGLVWCHLESNHKEEAEKVCLAAVRLAKKSVPTKLENAIRIQAGYNLGDIKLLEKEIKNLPELKYIVKLCNLSYMVKQQTIHGPELEQKIAKLLSRATGTIPAESTSKSQKSVPPSVFLEIGSFALDHDFVEVAKDCLSAVSLESIQNEPSLVLHYEIIKSQIQVQGVVISSGNVFTKSAVKTRVKNLQRLEEVVNSASRLKDSNTLEHACVVLWNLSMPLLQHNLCHHVVKPFTTSVKALGEIDSLMFALRATTYLELAKASAQAGNLEVALEHLEKASELDVDKQYCGQIQHYNHRFTMRGMTYEEPTIDFDKAARIIEQTSFLTEKDSKNKLRALLIKAGSLLAPKYFKQSLEGTLPSDIPMPINPGKGGSRKGSAKTRPQAGSPKDESKTKKQQEATVAKPDQPGSRADASKTYVSLDSLHPELADQLTEKAAMLSRYQAIWQMAQYYVIVVSGRHITGEAKCSLWGDLAKVARKNFIWDVALVAASFCVQFDGDVRPEYSAAAPTTGKSRSPSGRSHLIRRTKSMVITDPQSPSQICGKQSHKAVCQDRAGSISSSGIAKSLQVRIPSDYRLQVKVETVGLIADTFCILAECLVFLLKQDGLCLGEEPQASLVLKGPDSSSAKETEEWSKYVKCCSLWAEDASKHFLRAANLGVLMETPHRLSNAVVYLWNYSLKLIKDDRVVGLISTFRELLVSVKKMSSSVERLFIARVCTVLACGLVKKHTPSPDSQAAVAIPSRKPTAKKQDKKKGASVADVTPINTDAVPELKEAVEVCEYGVSMCTKVSMRVMKRLLVHFVQAKLLLQQPIPPKTFGFEEPKDAHTQNCRVLIAMEMASRHGKKQTWDFPNIPSVTELYSLLSESEWDDAELEMELWTALAQLALQHNEHDLVFECTSKTISLNKPSGSSSEVSKLEKRLLSQAYSLYGQSVIACSGGSVSQIRQALDFFLNSARFGGQAESRELVMNACGRYWNAALGLSSDSMERELLKEPLTELIDLSTPLSTRDCAEEKSDHDLLLSMFGIIFQSYIDQSAWEAGIKAVEKAIQRMPKSFYLDLLRYKMIFKSRLGRSVVSEMIRFQDEPELKVASLWHEAAENSTNPSEKLLNFKNSIEILTSEANSWLKIDYLMEFGEWMYQQDFPLPLCLAQFNMVVNILLKSSKTLDAPGGGSDEAERGSKSPSSSKVPSRAHTPHGGTRTDDGIVPAEFTESISQLELLVRVHVMMAKLQGEGSTGYREACVAATGYCYFIWKVIFGVMKKVEAPPVTHKTGQKAPPLHFPSSYKDWAQFQLSDQVIAYLSGTTEADTLKKSIHKPLLTLHYLETLATSLVAIDLHPMVLPVIQLELAIAQTSLSGSTCSLCKLLHMRFSHACIKLGLLSAAATNMEKVTLPIMEPNDLADSQVNMLIYESKKNAVAEEKARRSGSKSNKTTNLSGTTETGHSFEAKPFEIGDHVIPRELWVKQAGLFIHQGDYGVAKELLNQAITESNCFGDNRTLFQELIQAGLLAAAEKDVDKAIVSFTSALNLPCTRAGYFHGVLALSDVLLDNEEYREQYCEVIDSTMEAVKAMKHHRKNSKPEIDRITAVLNSRKALYLLQEVVTPGVNAGDLVGEKTQQHCLEVKEGVAVLLELGHTREASDLLMQLAGVCRSIGVLVEGNDHKEFILYALTLYRKAQQGLQCLYHGVVGTCQVPDDTELPVKLDLIEAQLEVVETLLVIFSEYSVERKKTSTVHQQKSSIQKLIDEYVQEAPDLSFVEQDWVTAATLACDESFNLIASAYSLATLRIHKAKCIGLLGRCTILYSSDHTSDAPSQWESIPDVAIYPPEIEEEIATVIEEDTEGNHQEQAEKNGSKSRLHSAVGVSEQPSKAILSNLSVVVRTKELEESRQLEAWALRSVATGTQALMDAIHLALAGDHWEIARKAALDVVECIGNQDPATSTLYLALYQSLKCSMKLSSLLSRLLPDPHYSLLSALLNQRDRLAASSWPSESQPMAVNSSRLNNFEVFKRLQVECSHLDHLRYFPANFRFLILQHSDDMSMLYAAYVIPSNLHTQSALKKGQPQMQTPTPTNPVISRAVVNKKDLWRLKEMMNKYQLSVYQTLHSTSNEILVGASEALTQYLDNVLLPISEALSKEKMKDLYLVILADMDLLSLPLETIAQLRQLPNVSSISRDFSLQVLKHRAARNLTDDTDQKDKKKPHSAPTSIPASISTFKYILDPSKDLSSNPDYSPTSQILTQIRNHAKLTSKWSGFSPNELPMTNREWPLLLKGATGLIYFGSERLLANFIPEQLVSLNIPDCTLAFIIDRMSTSNSIANISKLDSCKSSQDFEFERPVETTALFSLIGAGCIMTNQWYTTVQENVQLVNSVLADLLSEPKTVGRVFWQYKESRNEDCSDVTAISHTYNSVLYGMPHLALPPP